jgi:hypothetical protein
MTWWTHKSEFEEEPEVLVGNPEDMLPCNNQQTAIITPHSDPEPDLSTKPKDIVGYCFGFACGNGHIENTFDSITLDRYSERKMCQKCGGISKPSVVKRVAEANWGDKSYPSFPNNCHPEPKWGWYNHYARGFGKTAGFGEILWTKYEFVHFLDSPKSHKPRPRRTKK